MPDLENDNQISSEDSNTFSSKPSVGGDHDFNIFLVLGFV
jgi:hypothetical protein